MSDNPFVTVVTQESFPTEVTQRSAAVPVLVDFWADWCAPCKMLAPVLEKLALEYEGKFLMAKIDTEVERDLAAQFAVRSLPTVKVFRHGAPVDEFMGALPESAVREVIERHIERPADLDIAKAADLADSGNAEAALTLLKESLTNDPEHGPLRVALAQQQLNAKDAQGALETLKELPLVAKQEEEAKILQARIELALSADETGDTDELAQRVAQNPNDLSARNRLAAGLFHQPGQVEAAMTQLLEVIKRGRGTSEADQARQTLLQIFASLGNQDERVGRYRRVLAQALN
ncbi:MAG: thioredoxin [Acidiferrobacteraceae bacterium]|jgi:putative thioredoxin|nr:thioredoxin [Acidiferrobacteraceae bacterium]MBT3640967.1 thioredoxin [Acidiferrobacteraceae bacterium]MBT3770233.1 thioredoxin [Acidiferrobacteraceae bacterium]MBT3972428.1 thioredoxin [Acidiferrobacteraceae bacterium]MBT4394622.1 thioredoxin [Acidiferrobacteraceae bacterium]